MFIVNYSARRRQALSQRQPECDRQRNHKLPSRLSKKMELNSKTPKCSFSSGVYRGSTTNFRAPMLAHARQYSKRCEPMT